MDGGREREKGRKEGLQGAGEEERGKGVKHNEGSYYGITVGRRVFQRQLKADCNGALVSDVLQRGAVTPLAW